MDKSTIAIIWFAAAAVLGAGEIMLAGSFFLAPFAIGAVAAAIAALLGAGPFSFVVFILVSVGAFLALRPLAKRLDESMPDGDGLGANRLMESTGSVIEAIPGGPGNAGMIKIGSEEWRAESHTGAPIAVGTVVSVTKVTGTRLTVQPQSLVQ